MGDRTAFFYGTLMAPEVLHRVCYGLDWVHDPAKVQLSKTHSIKPAILHDYCRHQVNHADYPGIVSEKGHNVRGTYVTGLTKEDIRRLDSFEGSEYRRQKVNVALLKPDGQHNLVEKGEVQAETYVFIAGDGRLKKEEWDYEVFRKEKMWRWADHSEEYAEVDEAVADGHDPTGGRGIYGETAKLEDEKEILQSAV